MRKQVLCITIPICICILIAGAWLADAGPPDLNPPVGPVEVSGRFGTRTAITSLPFTIDQCGSYFLTDCLTGGERENGITINADDVTIALNGFSLIGVPGSIDGVRVEGAHRNITVKNGTVSDWDDEGVDLVNASNSVVINLQAEATMLIGKPKIANLDHF